MQTSDISIDPYGILPEVAKVKGQKLNFTTSSPFTPTFVESLFPPNSLSDSASVYTSRIQNRQVPLENPAKESRTKQLANQRRARQQRDAARKKSQVIGRKDAAARGVWKLEKEETRYDLFLPLNRMWKSYMAELLGLSHRPSNSLSDNDQSSLRMPSNTQAMQAKLVKADFHGSIMSVRSAKNPALVGLSGIVIHETENTFKVVTAKNKLKMIPKQNSIFAFAVPLYAPSSESINVPEPMIEFELYGDQFAFRSSDRTTRKFKQKLM